tara:strand:+ start:2292 stop:2822 length:531 start_codon:yes stop_codon:yes gene_type:complete
MAKKPVKRDLVWEYIDENWPFAKKDSIVRDTGVSATYAYKLLREYELIQKRTGNVHSSGRTEVKPVPTTPKIRSKNFIPQQQRISAEPTVFDGTSDGSTASYYELPDGSAELQDLISYKNMNAQIGEIFRAAYRYGESSHSDELRDAKKIMFYIEAEIKRLNKEERIAKIIGGLDA